MKFFRKSQLYTITIVLIVLIFAAIFLAKFHNIWRVSNVSTTIQSEKDLPNFSDLLTFEDQYTQWTLAKDTDETEFSTPLFDLFTPPNIYYEGKQLIMEPCLQWQFDTVFPLRLKNIKNKKYRLQFEGYIKPNSQAKYTIIIRDLENDQVLHCEEGQSFNSLEFTILAFHIKTIEQDDMIVNTPIVQLFDSRIQQKIELTGNVKYYNDQYDVILENVDGATYTLSEIGKEVKIGESICILDSIDPENKIVSITLIDAHKQEIHKRLRMLQ